MGYPGSEEENPGMNRLSREKSPYLLQHATNPVDWYPWGDEAFNRAKCEDKPVFLSIGYAACHWCHVMERESFADPETARLLNEAFVCIKVDREERPDLDQIYLTAAQAITGTAGWPLTILLTPDRLPFYAATYIPREARFGSPGLRDLIPRIVSAWLEKRSEILSAGTAIATAIRNSIPLPGNEPGEELLHRTFETLARTFDPENGGFGGAPKFPTPHVLMVLLRYWNRTGKRDALAMAASSLDAMAMGGIRDHIGGGFHRYSTDPHWLVPHFEKMLYDQALLGVACTEIFLATGNTWYREVAEDTLDYVLGRLSSPDGGFYSSEDADSEGSEGKYYLWTRDEIETVLGKDEAACIGELFHVSEMGNFREPGTGASSGKNILYRTGLQEICDRKSGREDPAVAGRIRQARQKLAEARSRRVPPRLDDKVLTDWNGLMIAALARAARVCSDTRDNRYLDAARRCADFILLRLRASDGRLLHRFRDGEAAIPALAADYAFLIWGLLELYEAGFEPRFLREARDLQKEFTTYFGDPGDGGYFSAPDDASDLLARQKELYDGALPSPNAVAFRNLIWLSRLTGNREYENEAERIARLYSGMAEQSPTGCTFFQIGLDFALGPSWELVICGDRGDTGAGPLLGTLNRTFLPSLLTLLRLPGDPGKELGEVAPVTRTMDTRKGEAVTAYLCSGTACSLVTGDPARILEILRAGPHARKNG
ncbi:MAG: thioredoxin domain-containing protein [Methanoregulaceae archaeon]